MARLVIHITDEGGPISLPVFVYYTDLGIEAVAREVGYRAQQMVEDYLQDKER